VGVETVEKCFKRDETEVLAVEVFPQATPVLMKYSESANFNVKVGVKEEWMALFVCVPSATPELAWPEGRR
jgi:hypothetical protein